jgi:hypothetical protein
VTRVVVADIPENAGRDLSVEQSIQDKYRRATFEFFWTADMKTLSDIFTTQQFRRAP